MNKLAFRIVLILALAGMCSLPLMSGGIGEWTVGVQTTLSVPATTEYSAEARDQVGTVIIRQSFVNATGMPAVFRYGVSMPAGVVVGAIRYSFDGVRWEAATVRRQDTATGSGNGSQPGTVNRIANILGNSANVFPLRDTIPAGGTVWMEVAVAQFLRYTDGRVWWTLPLGLGTSNHQSVTRSLTLGIVSTRGLSDLQSADINASVGNKQVEFYKTSLPSIGSRQSISLSWAVAMDSASVDVLSYRRGNNDGYVLLVATPQSVETGASALPKRFTFVVDRSGSMQGETWTNTVEVLRYCLDNLNPVDMFNVVYFNEEVFRHWGEHVLASHDNIVEAKNSIARHSPIGGTSIQGALESTFDMYRNDELVNVVIFLTDGRASVNRSALTSKNVWNVPTLVVGVGSGVDSNLLKGIAADSRGQFVNVTSKGQIVERVSQLYRSIRDPIIRNVTLSVSPDVLYDIMPESTPALYSGEQVVVAARYREAVKIDVALRGESSHGPVQLNFSGQLMEDSTLYPVVPQLWADMRIRQLLEQMSKLAQGSSTWTEMREEVIRLGIEHGLQTQFTTYEQSEDPIPTSVQFDERERDRNMVTASFVAGQRAVFLHCNSLEDIVDVELNLIDIQGREVGIALGFTLLGQGIPSRLDLEAMFGAIAPGAYVLRMRWQGYETAVSLVFGGM